MGLEAGDTDVMGCGHQKNTEVESLHGGDVRRPCGEFISLQRP